MTSFPVASPATSPVNMELVWGSIKQSPSTCGAEGVLGEEYLVQVGLVYQGEFSCYFNIVTKLLHYYYYYYYSSWADCMLILQSLDTILV